jgi:hypothetical protein
MFLSRSQYNDPLLPCAVSGLLETTQRATGIIYLLFYCVHLRCFRKDCGTYRADTDRAKSWERVSLLHQ